MLELILFQKENSAVFILRVVKKILSNWTLS